MSLEVVDVFCYEGAVIVTSIEERDPVILMYLMNSVFSKKNFG